MAELPGIVVTGASARARWAAGGRSLGAGSVIVAFLWRGKGRYTRD